jgi:hypothetical protein
MQKTIMFKMPAADGADLDVGLTLRSLSGYASMAVRVSSATSGPGEVPVVQFSGVERATLHRSKYAPGTDVLVGVVVSTAWSTYSLTVEAYAAGAIAAPTESQVRDHVPPHGVVTGPCEMPVVLFSGVEHAILHSNKGRPGHRRPRWCGEHRVGDLLPDGRGVCPLSCARATDPCDCRWFDSASTLWGQVSLWNWWRTLPHSLLYSLAVEACDASATVMPSERQVCDHLPTHAEPKSSCQMPVVQFSVTARATLYNIKYAKGQTFSLAWW